MNREAPAKTSRADRLLALEREDAAISKTLHRLTVRRRVVQQEMTLLRVSLTAAEMALYEAGRRQR